MCGYVHINVGAYRGIGSSWAGAAGGCEPPNVGTKNKLRSSRRAVWELFDYCNISSLVCLFFDRVLALAAILHRPTKCKDYKCEPPHLT